MSAAGAAAGAAVFDFRNSYARLPPRFFAKLPPTPVAEPRLLFLNSRLARELNLDPEALRSPEAVEVLAGNRVPEGADPLAMAYAGHQFGGWVPQLGDGRAILLGEVAGRDGAPRDIQLKGAGPTPFSRMGDGRAALGPVLREYIVSEAMAALGVRTTRALAAVATGEPVFRERPLPGAILTRVARSHIRVGTFQFFAARRDADGLRLLADHAIGRHAPEARAADNPYRALLEATVAAQAELIASWMLAGFIHGVMNTDNMSIAGETIDYGPCAFMDRFDPKQVYSSIDHAGRYAYANQPRIGHWNLSCLARAMVPLLAEDEQTGFAVAQKVLDGYPALYNAAWLDGLAAKIGLAERRDGDDDLALDLLGRMASNGADFTLAFRRLCGLAAAGPDAADARAAALFADAGAFDAWAARWRARLASDGRSDGERQAAMRAVNPAYIPRNHLVEEALDAAAERGDLGPARTLLEVLRRPFEERPGFERHARPPEPGEEVRATFCGT